MGSYSVGDRVMQSNYGHGTVTAVNEYHTRIEFDEVGARTFMTNRVTLEPSSMPAPVKKRARKTSKVATAKATEKAAAKAAAKTTAPA